MVKGGLQTHDSLGPSDRDRLHVRAAGRDCIAGGHDCHFRSGAGDVPRAMLRGALDVDVFPIGRGDPAGERHHVVVEFRQQPGLAEGEGARLLPHQLIVGRKRRIKKALALRGDPGNKLRQ